MECDYIHKNFFFLCCRRFRNWVWPGVYFTPLTSDPWTPSHQSKPQTHHKVSGAHLSQWIRWMARKRREKWAACQTKDGAGVRTAWLTGYFTVSVEEWRRLRASADERHDITMYQLALVALRRGEVCWIITKREERKRTRWDINTHGSPETNEMRWEQQSGHGLDPILIGYYCQLRLYIVLYKYSTQNINFNQRVKLWLN